MTTTEPAASGRKGSSPPGGRGVGALAAAAAARLGWRGSSGGEAGNAAGEGPGSGMRRRDGAGSAAVDSKPLNPLRALLHPFESFAAVKDEGKGSLTATGVIVIVFFLATIFKRQSTGYIFNMADLSALNVWIMGARTIALYGLWVAANWAVATWMDGEGKAKQIAVVSAYAIIPYVAALVGTTLLSNVLVHEEGMFLDYIMTVAVLWSALLMFIGMNIIHDYGAARTLQSIMLTFAAMGIALFLAVLFYTLFNQVYLFFYTIYNELLFRL